MSGPSTTVGRGTVALVGGAVAVPLLIDGDARYREYAQGECALRAPLPRCDDRAAVQRGLNAQMAVVVGFGLVAAAGVVRMPYLRFAIASIPGALVWALVWATIGFGAVWAALALFATSPWVLTGAVLLHHDRDEAVGGAAEAVGQGRVSVRAARDRTATGLSTILRA